MELVNKIKTILFQKKPKCNICGGTSFVSGYNNRKSPNGKYPKCVNCKSVERHRIVHDVFLKIPESILKKSRVLQFSPDPSVKSHWFLSYEVSTYGSGNSLDLENINKPDSSYDIVLCNHVLEHVKDDIKAFSELIRILTPDGFLQITVPMPMTVERTNDWGYPDKNKAEHYRVYGKDLLKRFRLEESGIRYLQVVANDPVTDRKDIVYLFSKSSELIKFLEKEMVKNYSIIRDNS